MGSDNGGVESASEQTPLLDGGMCCHAHLVRVEILEINFYIIIIIEKLVSAVDNKEDDRVELPGLTWVSFVGVANHVIDVCYVSL